MVIIDKVHIFWEGHKILRNLHLTFVLVVPVKSKVKISQNFVAFSEYMNFIYLIQLGIQVEFLHLLCRHLYSTHHQHKLHLFDEKKNMLLLFNQYFIMAQDSLLWQSRFAQFWQDFAAKALLLVNRTELEIFWQKPYFWSFLLPELEIFWQDFAAKALVLVNPTVVEIV